jgi:chromosome segregation ATPase
MQGMEEEEVKLALTSLHVLFKEVYISNCRLDNEEPTSPELRTIEEFDFIELVENLREIVMYLVSFKQEFAKSEQGEQISRAEQMEQLLQKLEDECRRHIRVEQQLKLHIDNLQGKLEQTEHDKLVLEQDHATLKAKVLEFEEEILKLRSSEHKAEERLRTRESSTPDTMGSLAMKMKTFHKRSKEGSRPLGKLELDISRLRTMLEVKESECKKLLHLLKASRRRQDSFETRHEQVRSPLRHIDGIGQKSRLKKTDNSRRSMGDFNPRHADSSTQAKKDLKLDRVNLYPRSSPVRSVRSRSELSQRGLFLK